VRRRVLVVFLTIAVTLGGVVALGLLPREAQPLPRILVLAAGISFVIMTLRSRPAGREVSGRAPRARG